MLSSFVNTVRYTNTDKDSMILLNSVNGVYFYLAVKTFIAIIQMKHNWFHCDGELNASVVYTPSSGFLRLICSCAYDTLL